MSKEAGHPNKIHTNPFDAKLIKTPTGSTFQQQVSVVQSRLPQAYRDGTAGRDAAFFSGALEKCSVESQAAPFYRHTGIICHSIICNALAPPSKGCESVHFA